MAKKVSKLLIVLVLCGVSWPGLAFKLAGGVGVSLVNMAYLNETLAAMAARQGVAFSPIILGWNAEVAAWPWPLFGVKGNVLWASGVIQGREALSISVSAFGGEICGGFSFPLYILPAEIEAGIGAYLVSASGLIEGYAVAFGGYALLGARLFTLLDFALDLGFGFRYLPVRTLVGGRETIAPEGMNAVDFSGLFVSLVLKWGK